MAGFSNTTMRLLIVIFSFFLTTTKCWALSSPTSSTLQTIQQASLIDAVNGNPCQLSQKKDRKSLVILVPQLGEFDSSEFCQPLVQILPTLENEKIDLQIIGIGSLKAAQEFSKFTRLPLSNLKLSPKADLHKALKLHQGPNWEVPDFCSEDFLTFSLNQLPGKAPADPNLLQRTGRAWFNYLLMCAGIGAPGTLLEILRGYFGDASAPERFPESSTVKAGFVTIGPGVGPVTLGPFSYQQWWADERGYQRPVELATVRLQNMVEVLTKWDTYVEDPTTIDQRGGTFLFDEAGELLYEYKHRGVLTYSETMPRPLTFLKPYIGEELAKNPLGLPDTIQKTTNARGWLKPAGRFMSLLQPLFQLENKLQAKLQGVTPQDLQEAKQEIQQTIESSPVVIYTYGLSPFSSQAVQLLQDAGCTNFQNIELGPEWFLLDKEASTKRAALLELTGQSSLPHVFVDGNYVGGIFSGIPGLAALQESGKLQEMLSSAEPSLSKV
jgi:glutaredoxin-related protein